MVPHRPLPFARRADRRVVAGVAGGFADTYGVDPVLVRGALVLMALTGGLGLVVYALGFAWAVEAERATVAPASRGTWRDGRRTVAFACIATGGVLVGRGLGLWFGDPFMIAAVAVVAGLGVLGAFDPGGAALVQAPVASRVRVEWRLPGMTEGRHARLRILGGALLVAIGLVVVGGQSGVPGRVRQGVFATACTFVGVAVLLGPWIARAARDVAEERRRRIRSDERAAMAAHLHDSVLQTLALIQRSAADPRRTVTLARRQERELRTWLYGGDAPYETLAAALRSMAADVEASYDVAVDAVVAGDRPMDDVGAALVAAAREACVNAAKHAGVGEVSVFVEIGVEAIDAFVRDRGRGFDRGAVAPDRRGISESIEGRVHRAGGITEIESIVGKGTEVHLRLPIVDDAEVVT